MSGLQNSGAETPADRARSAERPLIVLKQTVLVAALILLPLFYTLVPPLEDYPNHLARMQALASIPGNSFLSRFYEVEWAPIPNLIMDLIVPPLVPFFGVYAAGQIFVGLTLLLMLLGPMLLHRTLDGRWSAWPLVGGLFVYNGFLFTGLMNYLFGVGVAVLGLAVWIRLCGKPLIMRGLASLAFCAVLYVCHLSALGLYGLGIASFEFWRLWTHKAWKPAPLLRSALALGVPFLPFLYLLVRSPTWGLSHDVVWESQGKLEAITLFFSVYSDATDIPLLILIAIAIGIAVKRGLVSVHPAGLIVACTLTVAFLAMPRVAFGSWMADQRLVVGIFFMTLGFISVGLRRLEGHNAFFAVCLVAVAFRVVDVSAHWVAISQPLLELKSSLRLMPEGSRLLVTEADDPAEAAIDVALSHAPTLAVIERSALVSRLFVVPGKQILHARPPYGGHVDTEDGDTPRISRVIVDSNEEGASADGPHYWDKWPDFYDYLIVLGTDPDETANPAPDLLQIARIGRGFQLYKVRKAS
ncbi:hypothetical protein GGR34_003600 [Microvirga flocculans]|uniref:Glycosyltransferase RgtA/B/C/D-like domain-containing protein n=1 Tax=Microvirga flocculans TaxID=217168 RepID=A0A7W6II63_9HYPH|nr:hypothetical protein [Microvirga flocculans]MBB4041917.1 hypothetical protein [Microvirga flocculans]